LFIMAQFQLQPSESELQQLADQCWQKAGEREHELERTAFEAGTAIRNGEYSLANLEAIVRWKSERVVHYLIANGEAKIRKALEVAAAPGAPTRRAIEALMELRGVDLAIASAILSAIRPDLYNVLDYRTLEALGHARHDIEFYVEYAAFCRRLAERGLVKPQADLPGATPLHALERAMWEWSRSRAEHRVLA
jgi:hypothetical protein